MGLHLLDRSCTADIRSNELPCFTWSNVLGWCLARHDELGPCLVWMNLGARNHQSHHLAEWSSFALHFNAAIAISNTRQHAPACLVGTADSGVLAFPVPESAPRLVAWQKQTVLYLIFRVPSDSCLLNCLHPPGGPIIGHIHNHAASEGPGAPLINSFCNQQTKCTSQQEGIFSSREGNQRRWNNRHKRLPAQIGSNEREDQTSKKMNQKDQELSDQVKNG